MDFSFLLDTSITRETLVGITTSGDPVYGERGTLNARVEVKSELVRRGAAGDEARSSTQVWADGEVKEGDRIWLPGEDPAVDAGHEVLNVEAIPDLSGDIPLWHVFL